MDKIYKLLRNNRQTGPHTLDELVQLGLKPFDLIWADGKTAGWMYPSEIDVLKPYLAEEKKEVVKAAAPVPSAPTGTPVPEVVSAPAGVAHKAVAVPSSAKHIFISLPAGATGGKAVPVQNTAIPNAATPQAAAEEETPEQKLERKAMELRQKVQALAEAKKKEGEEPALDTKYSRSLDDIKEEYTHWMHEQRHKGTKSISVRAFKAQGKRAALVLFIAGAGYGAFQWWSAPGASDTTFSGPPPVTTVPVSAPVSTKEKEPAQSVINTDYNERNADLLTDLEKANRQIEEDLERIRSKEKPVAQTRRTEPPVSYDLPDTYDEYEEAASVTYEPQKREPAPSAQPPVRTVSYRTEKKAVPLSQLIDVKAKYLWTQRNRGLSGLELALRNNSTQVLKTVAIDVFYYKDDRLLDKKTVYFNDVQPGQSFTLIAPGNKRASSATYQMGLISSDGGLYVAKQ